MSQPGRDRPGVCVVTNLRQGRARMQPDQFVIGLDLPRRVERDHPRDPDAADVVDRRAVGLAEILAGFDQAADRLDRHAGLFQELTNQRLLLGLVAIHGSARQVVIGRIAGDADRGQLLVVEDQTEDRGALQVVQSRLS